MLVLHLALRAVLQKCPAGKKQTTQIATNVFLCMYTYLVLFTHIFQCLYIRLVVCVLLNPCPHMELVYKLMQLSLYVAYWTWPYHWGFCYYLWRIPHHRKCYLFRHSCNKIICVKIDTAAIIFRVGELTFTLRILLLSLTHPTPQEVLFIPSQSQQKELVYKLIQLP